MLVGQPVTHECCWLGECNLSLVEKYGASYVLSAVSVHGCLLSRQKPLFGPRFKPRMLNTMSIVCNEWCRCKNFKRLCSFIAVLVMKFGIVHRVCLRKYWCVAEVWSSILSCSLFIVLCHLKFILISYVLPSMVLFSLRYYQLVAQQHL